MRRHASSLAPMHGKPALNYAHHLARVFTFLAFAFPLAIVGWALFALFQVPLDQTTDPDEPLFNRYIWRAVRFTILQAGLSAVLSVAIAIPLARALAFRTFPGRGLLIALFGAPFILPVIVAVLGLLAIWGPVGLISIILAPIGIKPLSPYGLSGILLAHVFFNLPLATRILLQGWQSLPPESWRLSAQLGMGQFAILRHIEWPMLRPRIPGALSLVFLLCVTSFSVVLALGGGPKATTIELAIYQAIRFDFDLTSAAILALLQIALCTALAVVARLWAADPDFGQSLGTAYQRVDLDTLPMRLWDGLIIGFATLYLALPMIAALWRGAIGMISHTPDIEKMLGAMLRSLYVAGGATLITALIGITLAIAASAMTHRYARLMELPGFAILVAPPIALGAGLFVLLKDIMPIDDMALPMAALLNGLQATPFTLILLTPAFRQVRLNYGPLADQLGMKGLSRLRLVYWPVVRKPAGTALGLAAALSAGDLGVIALFGAPAAPTLPLFLYQQMGAYRMDGAFATGLVLVCFALSLFILFDRGLGGNDRS